MPIGIMMIFQEEELILLHAAVKLSHTYLVSEGDMDPGDLGMSGLAKRVDQAMEILVKAKAEGLADEVPDRESSPAEKQLN
jgi:hypothetical protein